MVVWSLTGRRCSECTAMDCQPFDLWSACQAEPLRVYPGRLVVGGYAQSLWPSTTADHASTTSGYCCEPTRWLLRVHVAVRRGPPALAGSGHPLSVQSGEHDSQAAPYSAPCIDHSRGAPGCGAYKGRSRRPGRGIPRQVTSRRRR